MNPYLAPQIAAIRGFVTASAEWERRVELVTWQALCALEQLGEEARRRLGLRADGPPARPPLTGPLLSNDQLKMKRLA